MPTTATTERVDDLQVTVELTVDPVHGPVVSLDVEHLASLWPTHEVMHAAGLLSLDEAEDLARRVLALVALGRGGVHR